MNTITKYEKARLLGQRASQLAEGAKSTVNPKGEHDMLKIAEMEFNAGTIPVDIVRTLPDGSMVKICVSSFGKTGIVAGSQTPKKNWKNPVKKSGKKI